MISDIAKMTFLCFVALVTVALVARIPDAPGHYTDPAWIVAALVAVLMVQGFYVATWLYRTLCTLGQLLLILTGAEPDEAQFPLQATLRRLRKLLEELTTAP